MPSLNSKRVTESISETLTKPIAVDTRIFTVPNQLTFLRLGFLPFFLIAVYYNHYIWALLLLIAAGASDGLDGLVARVLNQRSPLGAYLDPIADKLLMSASFLMLASKGKIAWWLAILVVSRDVLLLAASATILIVVGYRPLPPSIWGKITTTAEILLILVVVLQQIYGTRWLILTKHWGIFVVAFFVLLSWLHYSVVISRRLHDGL
jgi:cardiolipin synthase (CMP-forming)